MTPAERKRDVIDTDERPICSEYTEKWELFGAEPGCRGRITDAPGGGVKCTQCKGWFCF